MKEKLSTYLLATLMRVGALWVGFLVSVLPLYLLRGSIHDTDTLVTVENLSTSAVILLSSAIFLFFLYRRDDEVARMDTRGLILLCVVPTLIHMLVCAATAFTSNLTVISTGMGYAALNLLEPDAHGIAELSMGVKLSAALLVPPFPALGALLGGFAARRRRTRERAELRGEKGTDV